MTTLIAYSTTEGHSAKIALFAADQLAKERHVSEVFDLDDSRSRIDLAKFKRVILAGSVHERRHAPALETFMQAQREALTARPVLLLSVSLSAAFDQGMEEAEDYVIETKMRTRYAPSDVVLVAGAVKPNSYDYFAQQVVKFVVLKDRVYEMGTDDHEFTDWSALAERLHHFVESSHKKAS